MSEKRIGRKGKKYRISIHIHIFVNQKECDVLVSALLQFHFSPFFQIVSKLYINFFIFCISYLFVSKAHASFKLNSLLFAVFFFVPLCCWWFALTKNCTQELFPYPFNMLFTVFSTIFYFVQNVQAYSYSSLSTRHSPASFISHFPSKSPYMSVTLMPFFYPC